MWWIGGGIAATLLVLGAIGTSFALNDDGGSGDGSGGSVSGKPTVEAEADGESLVFTMNHDNFTDGDQYAIKTAPTRDNFGPATAYTVSEVEDGTGTYTLPVRSGTEGCGQVQVVRDADGADEERSEWSDIVCATGEGS